MSTIVELLDRLHELDEDRHIEFKKASDLKHAKSVLETINAFSNEPGLGKGYILLGIEETLDESGVSHNVVGVDDVDKTQRDIATQCAEVFNMPIRPVITVEKFQGKDVVLIEVKELEHNLKPLYFKNKGLPKGAYRRIGSTDQHCTEDDLSYFYSTVDGFDETLVEGSSLDDLSYEAIDLYRKLRQKINPDAEELQCDDLDLLRALNCVKQDGEQWKLTYCGLIVFGSKLALRRLMPMIRVDYIRVNGKEWVENPEERYSKSLDFRGPLITLVHRIIGVISDDLPATFLLPEGHVQAESKHVLPLRVIREAVVNAFIHRSYRVHSPIQIVRYSNRIEIINAGFSLKSDDAIGQPGSVIRNATISAIFHETNLAETKGTGFALMQKLMQKSKMLPVTFDSSREENSFTLRLLFHHFLSELDVNWLRYFDEFSLSDSQKMVLIFVREVGAINNQSLRQLCGLSARDAGSVLKQLTKKELLLQKGVGKNTYYIPDGLLLSLINEEVSVDFDGLSTMDDGLSTMDDGLSTMDDGLSTMDDGLSTPWTMAYLPWTIAYLPWTTNYLCCGIMCQLI